MEWIKRLKAEIRQINPRCAITGAVIILLCGILSAVVTYLLGGSTWLYKMIRLPSFAPPRLVFPLVWTVLYVLIGAAAGNVFCSEQRGPAEVAKYKGLLLFVLMMVLNFIWSPLFFAANSFFLALLDIAAMLVLTFFTIYFFSKVSAISAAVMILYIIWLIFAFFLNLSVVFLNC